MEGGYVRFLLIFSNLLLDSTVNSSTLVGITTDNFFFYNSRSKISRNSWTWLPGLPGLLKICRILKNPEILKISWKPEKSPEKPSFCLKIYFFVFNFKFYLHYISFPIQIKHFWQKKLTLNFFLKNSLGLRKKKLKKNWKKWSPKILNFNIDLQQYNPYDALMVKNYNKKSLFFNFQDFQDYSGTLPGIPNSAGSL